MKLPRLVCLVVWLSVAAVAARGQAFEGVLRWSVQTEITDPAIRAQMEAARQDLANPAKVAELQALLDGPQNQEVLTLNPEMRTALEMQLRMAKLAAAGDGDLLGAMAPRAMTLQVKAGRTHLSLEGGAKPVEFVGREGTAELRVIDRAARTVTVMPAWSGKSESVPGVTKTSDTAEVLGYACDRYLVATSPGGKALTGEIWATTALTGLDAALLGGVRLGGTDDAYLAGIKGVPLKYELRTAEMILRVEITEVRAGPVDDVVFAIPADFTVVEQAPPAS